jgi:hypothetical protein
MNSSDVQTVPNESNQNHHHPDLKEAIYYLPPNFDQQLICTALKTIYPEKGKELTLEWYLRTKNSLPSNFDEYWEQLGLTSYQRHTLDDYLKENLYDVAKQAGWIPKALRKGKNTKRPPSK